MKFYAFKVPKGSYTTRVNITGLTDDFYPEVYLQENVLTKALTNAATELTYPHAGSNRKQVLVFGESFFDIVHTNQQSYIIKGTASGDFNYYAMSIYYRSFGLTDRRKAEF